MIGIDIARVKRWFKKANPQYDDISYEIELMIMSATSVDHQGGMKATFLVNVYTENGSVAYYETGKYTRFYYGGWGVNLPEEQTASLAGDEEPPTSLTDDEEVGV